MSEPDGGTVYLVAFTLDGDELHLSPAALAAAHAEVTQRAERTTRTERMRRMHGEDSELAGLSDAELAAEEEAREEDFRMSVERVVAAGVERHLRKLLRLVERRVP
jgi:hypothetical protein